MVFSPNQCSSRFSYVAIGLSQLRSKLLFPSFPRKGGPTALHCAHRTSTFLVCAFCEQEELFAIPSYPPGPADLYVCAIDVAGLIAQEIADGCHRIVDGADVAGWDAFGHAGEFPWRRTA